MSRAPTYACSVVVSLVPLIITDQTVSAQLWQNLTLQYRYNAKTLMVPTFAVLFVKIFFMAKVCEVDELELLFSVQHIMVCLQSPLAPIGKIKSGKQKTVKRYTPNSSTLIGANTMFLQIGEHYTSFSALHQFLPTSPISGLKWQQNILCKIQDGGPLKLRPFKIKK